MHGISVVPPGGWSYQDHRMPQAIEGEGEADLADVLLKYRIANNIPVGDPLGDVQAYLRTQNPRLHGVIPEPNYDPQLARNPANYRERVTQWISERLTQGISGALRYVSIEEMQERAAICEQCPNNQSYKTGGGCPSCLDNTDRSVMIVTQGKLMERREVLHGCRVMNQDNRAAATLALEHLDKPNEEQFSNLPDFCWMKKNKSELLTNEKKQT